jgi:adenylate kinase family enzyme
LAARLAGNLGVSHLELHALRHQPDWVPLPDCEFVQRVSSFFTGDAWVVDGNYFDLVTEPVVWPAADTVVWIDLPKATVIRRVLARTLKRWRLRQELWDGNRENCATPCAGTPRNPSFAGLGTATTATGSVTELLCPIPLGSA